MDFGQDWFLRQVESFAEGVARKFLDKPDHEEYVQLPQSGDDPLAFWLRALLARLEFCAAEDLLWEHLRPGDPGSLLRAEEFYHSLGGFGSDILQAHDFSRQDVEDGLQRARAFIGAVE